MENGKLTRRGGAEVWILNAQYHRTDGPAYIHANGGKSWYKHGKRHRTDGPAMIHPQSQDEWWINGKELTESEILIRKESIEFDEMMREMLSVNQ